MTHSIGVYVCSCAATLAEALDLEQVRLGASALPGVQVAKICGVACRGEALNSLQEDIATHGLTALVVAACSPREIASTLEAVAAQAGLNPFLVQIANLREQCAWVTPDPAAATRKAARLVAAAVARVATHRPLAPAVVVPWTDVLVVGAGVAGMSAALTSAGDGRSVCLVERLPHLGGNAARLDRIGTDLECASCRLSPLAEEVLRHPRVRVLPLTEVRRVRGRPGRFLVDLRTTPRGVRSEACLGCGSCVDACPVRGGAIRFSLDGSLPNAPFVDWDACLRGPEASCGRCAEACPSGAVTLEVTGATPALQVGAIVFATGYEAAPAVPPGWPEVLSAFDFEQLLNPSGPTAGEIRCRDGREPRRIALLHCTALGARPEGGCAGLCCASLLKGAVELCERLEEVQVLELFTDLCLPGRGGAGLLARAEVAEGLEFRRLNGPCASLARGPGSPEVCYVGPDGEPCRFEADLVVAPALLRGSPSAAGLARSLRLAVDPQGFLRPAQPEVQPVGTAHPGVYVVGCAQGPMGIAAASAQGQAAAGVILSSLRPGEPLTLDPCVARVDPARCSGCGVCLSVCAYGALAPGESEVGIRTGVELCHGCGACAAACPCGAIELAHFGDEQIAAELTGLLSGLPGRGGTW